MGYISNGLMPGEEIAYRTRLHWVIFAKPIWIMLFGTAAYAVLGHAVTPAVAKDPMVDRIVLYLIRNRTMVLEAVLVFAAISMLGPLIEFATSEFGITNRRVILKVGFLWRKSTEIILMKVEAVEVRQGIMGRLLGFGSITITGTGGSKDSFHNINNPLMFRRILQAEIFETENERSQQGRG